MIKAVIIMLTSAALLFACNNNSKKPGSSILKKEKMEAVLWDVLRADAFTFQFITKDTFKKPEAALVQLQQQIFAVHKITREEFYQSLDYYKVHPDVFQPMLDSMISRYTRDKYAVITQSTVPVIKADTLKVKKDE